ncbi:hypothetical protein G6F65_019994 [Rhizopus arrhizus]|nr:hypothetical protein G6F65_019994 [Rhizopus arrhizus]
MAENSSTSSRRSQKGLTAASPPCFQGRTANTRSVRNGRFALTKASAINSHTASVWFMAGIRLQAQRRTDGLDAQRHQAARQQAQHQHHGTVDRQQATLAAGGGDRCSNAPISENSTAITASVTWPALISACSTASLA